MTDLQTSPRDRLLDAGQQVFLGRWYDEIALAEVARVAGVSEDEAVRHFPDRGRLLRSIVQERFTPSVERVRYRGRPGDLEAAIAALVDDYERTGDAILRALTLEPRFSELRYALDAWRESHKRWICWAFSALVEGVPPDQQWSRLEQLATVLDVYVWNLHRRELGRSPTETAHVLRRLAQSVIGCAEGQAHLAPPALAA